MSLIARECTQALTALPTHVHLLQVQVATDITMLTKRAAAVDRGSRALASKPRTVRVLAALPKASDIASQVSRAAQASLLVVATSAASLLLAGSSFADVSQTTRPGANLGFLSDKEVVERRDALGIIRAFDGKVALRSSQGTAWDIKLDLKSPGTLLLRSPDGRVHYLAYESLTQIDLSDDEVVGAIANGPWEKGSKAVEGTDDNNELQRLEMTREGFYELISVVDP